MQTPKHIYSYHIQEESSKQCIQ